MSEPTPNLPVVPDYLKAMTPGSSQGDLDSIASAAMSIPRISMRGKKFRFMEGGEEIVAVNDKVEVIIFGVEPDTNHFIKTYYDKPYTGVADSNPPACASDDGVRPSGWVSSPQHTNCAECPKNRFGSATSRTGKPAKACRDSKRLWVARRDDIGKEEKPTIYALQVPVTSLKTLSEFGRSMKAMNVPISAAVTLITMDDDSEFPMISFSCIGFLPEVEAKAAIARSELREWKLNYPSAPALSGPVPNIALPGQPAPAAAANGGQAAPVVSDPNKKADMADIVKNW